MTVRTVRTVIRTIVSCFLTRASMGKSNYYDKMKWQDSIKVIITQKLHQIRNWEFHNMLNGMSTIEMIENLKIKNLTENRVIRRFGWPPTIYIRRHTTRMCVFFSSPEQNAQVSYMYCRPFSSVVRRPSSVNFLHFHLLLETHGWILTKLGRNHP